MKMFRTLAKYVKEYIKPSIITPLLMLGEVLMETIIPLLMASIVNDGIEKGELLEVLNSVLEAVKEN